MDDSKEKTSVIPVETPEIDTGQLAEAVNGCAVVADYRASVAASLLAAARHRRVVAIGNTQHAGLPVTVPDAA